MHPLEVERGGGEHNDSEKRSIINHGSRHERRGGKAIHHNHRSRKKETRNSKKLQLDIGGRDEIRGEGEAFHHNHRITARVIRETEEPTTTVRDKWESSKHKITIRDNRWAPATPRIVSGIVDMIHQSVEIRWRRMSLVPLGRQALKTKSNLRGTRITVCLLPPRSAVAY